jgi:hypothetical protein
MSHEKRETADDELDRERKRKVKQPLAEEPAGKAEKTFHSFGYDYINEYIEQYQKNYVKQHKKNSAWNETQLNLIVETFVNFIDCYTEEFLKAGFPLDPVWVFERLRVINAHVQEHNFSWDDQRLKGLEEPIFQFKKFANYSDKRLIPFGVLNLISKPHQLMLRWFYMLDLPRFDKETATSGEWLQRQEQQGKEMHTIADELLLAAINRIKDTDAYQQAARSGKRYYMPEGSASSEEAKPTSLNAKPTPASMLSPTSSPTRRVGLFDSSLATSHSQVSSSSSQENSGGNSSMGFSKSNE